MRIMRRISLFALVLVLAAGSVGMALARNHPNAAGMVELCTTWGTATVLVDAQGDPVAPSHPCPHCTPALAALTEPATPLCAPPSTLLPLRWAIQGIPGPSAPASPPFHSRAPPVAV